MRVYESWLSSELEPRFYARRFKHEISFFFVCLFFTEKEVITSFTFHEFSHIYIHLTQETIIASHCQISELYDNYFRIIDSLQWNSVVLDKVK